MSLPDPLDPASFNHRFVRIPSNGRRYHLVDQPPLHWQGPLEDAPTLLLCHGFPDLWYGWRHQIRAFAARGWRVLCPDQLGYGETDKVTITSAYSYKSVAYDMNSLLNECGVPGKVVLVAHDWGGMAAWRFVNYFPERVIAIASVCTPYLAPATPSSLPISDVDLIRNFVPNFGYQLYFQQERASKELDEVADVFLQPMHSPAYRRRTEKPKDSEMAAWVTEGRLEKSIGRQIEARRAGKLPPPPPETELDVYLNAYRKGGFAAPLNWYRTRQINFREEQLANLPPFPPHIPCLQLPASHDAALPPSMALSPAVLRCFPAGNLDVRVLEGADHWCLHDERMRDKVTGILADWIERVLAGKWQPSGRESHL